MQKRIGISQEAETVAIEALGFIAADPELLPRFLAMSGIEAHAIRQAAGEPGFLAGVLHFVVSHEPTLLGFSEASGIAPARVTAAMRAMPFGDDTYQHST